VQEMVLSMLIVLNQKTIAELKQYGLKVLPVIKGKDSINYGIQLIQEQPFKVTSRSSNLIKELQNYVWSKDKKVIYYQYQLILGITD
jgi:hypothetical protein